MRLAGAFAAQGEAVQQLAAPLQRSLAKVLCQAAVGLGEPAAVHAYITQLLHRVAGTHPSQTLQSDPSTNALPHG